MYIYVYIGQEIVFVVITLYYFLLQNVINYEHLLATKISKSLNGKPNVPIDVAFQPLKQCRILGLSLGL